MKLTRLLTIAVASVLAIGAVQADETGLLELLRSDFRTDKIALITATLQLTEEEGKAFWPIYRLYNVEVSNLGDKRLEGLKYFAEHFNTMSDEKASELATAHFQHRQNRLDILKKYHGKMATAVSPIRAAQFVQIESQIASLIDAQIAGELSLIRPGEDMAKE